MTDNVLGVLFQDIADAIRSKTGDTNKIAPHDFATAISNLTIGNDNNSSVKVAIIEADYHDGPYFNRGQASTVQHNLGIPPDIIFMIIDGSSGYGTAEDDAAVILWGFSEKFATTHSIPARLKNGCINYPQKAPNLVPAFGYAIDSSVMASYGFIQNATSTSFSVFSPTLLQPASEIPYNIIVIGGLA